MFKRFLLSLSSIMVTLFLLAGCSATPAAEVKASLGQEFTLPIGQTAVINGENLNIKFAAVTADSRCPKGVTCIWAGEAKCQTYFSFDNNKTAPASLELTDNGGQVDGYSQVTWVSYAGPTYKINFRLNDTLHNL